MGQGSSHVLNPTFLWENLAGTVAQGNNYFCQRCENIYDGSRALCPPCRRTVCMCADNKHSIYNKNKHSVVELGLKDPVKALQGLILAS